MRLAGQWRQHPGAVAKTGVGAVGDRLRRANWFALGGCRDNAACASRFLNQMGRIGICGIKAIQAEGQGAVPAVLLTPPAFQYVGNVAGVVLLVVATLVPVLRPVRRIRPTRLSSPMKSWMQVVVGVDTRALG